MNNQRRCFFCSSSTMKFQPITNKKGEIISLHNICQSCDKNQTLHSLKKKQSTLNLKRSTKPTKKKSRVLKGYAVGIVSAATMFFACNALAQIDTSVTYTASSTPQTIKTIPQKHEILKPETIKEKILRYSLKYDVSPVELENIVKCETGATDVNKASTTIQSRYLIGTPRRELSFGVSQIHVSAHGITKEQAYDVDYSLDFLAKHWSLGHKDMWYNCSIKNHYL